MPSRRVLIALVLLAFALVLALALLDARHDSDPRGAARSSAAELGAQAVETELERGGVAEREIPPASAQTTAPQAAAGGDRARVARLRARCVDEAGRALAGIRCVDVNTQVLRAESARDGRIDVELALSAADETRFAIGLLADFRRPVFADRGVRLGEVWDLGDVVLLPAGRIRGRVVDARALPVSGAWITSTRTSFARWRETYEDDSITAVTGADGVFLLEGAPVGALRVAARAPRHALVAVEPIDVAPGLETGGVEIVLGEALAADDAFDVCVLDP
ncbi:MAG: carboxypeptidase regulatory-like domain-containing protein, partial [Planctomycetes bacterium]|nr:carboxypeptidase regulatory-like domain-containing protein [Planctomycetota bacterium]